MEFSQPVTIGSFKLPDKTIDLFLDNSYHKQQNLGKIHVGPNDNPDRRQRCCRCGYACTVPAYTGILGLHNPQCVLEL